MSDTYEDSVEMSSLSQVIDDDHMLEITSNFKRLGERCYLENAGAALYPESLIVNVNEDLLNNVYMNTHSDSYTKDYVEQIRSAVLKHFNTDPDTYSVVFTSGTTQSLRNVVETFQFASEKDNDKCRGTFLYLRDNHTSVLGLREIAAQKNANIIYLSHDEFLIGVKSPQKKIQTWKDKFKGHSDSTTNALIAYPAQSNFNGYKYPLDCIENIKNGCLNNYLKKHSCKNNSSWYVLLDAASYVSTSRLDLSKIQPDFVCLSFYKIFGYPTGLGALLVKNTSISTLCEKRYFGGGTVDIVLSSENFHVKRKKFTERFEDGTISFLSILSLKHCFDTLQRLIPRTAHDNMMDTISYHTFYLARDLYHQLKELHHSNGNKAAVLYMDSDFSDIKQQGGIVTFNLIREDGSYIGFSEFQHMADLFKISVRTGCFCNSGSCQRHFNISNQTVKDMYKAGHVCGDTNDLHNSRPTGGVRVSFGYYNTFKDIDTLLHMICRCFITSGIKRPIRTYATVNKRIENNFSPLQKVNNNFTMYNKSKSYEYLKDSEEEEEEYYDIDTKIIIKEAAVYPIKSCGPFKVTSSWKIGPKGFEYDREWMIVKDNGVCLTQKQNPRMCMIRPKIDLKLRVMFLSFEGMNPITVPLDVTPHLKLKQSSLCHTKVCTDLVKAYDCGDEVADWISEALEISYLRLIRQSSNDQRTLKRQTDGIPKSLSFSNQAQFLLINRATVRWLKNKIIDPDFHDNLDQLTNRFRGNIILDMEEELVERDWQRVIIGNQEFKVEGQCQRCTMVCIDQRNGEKTIEPLRTISELFEGKLRFGIYLSYVGPVDGSNDNTFKLHTHVTPFINDDISR